MCVDIMESHPTKVKLASDTGPWVATITFTSGLRLMLAALHWCVKVPASADDWSTLFNPPPERGGASCDGESEKPLDTSPCARRQSGFSTGTVPSLLSSSLLSSASLSLLLFSSLHSSSPLSLQETWLQ